MMTTGPEGFFAGEFGRLQRERDDRADARRTHEEQQAARTRAADEQYAKDVEQCHALVVPVLDEMQAAARARREPLLIRARVVEGQTRAVPCRWYQVIRGPNVIGEVRFGHRTSNDHVLEIEVPGAMRKQLAGRHLPSLHVKAVEMSDPDALRRKAAIALMELYRFFEDGTSVGQ